MEGLKTSSLQLISIFTILVLPSVFSAGNLDSLAFNENEKYWRRILNTETGTLSMPTTLSPTSSTEPKVSCDISINLSCFLTDDPTSSCDNFQKPAKYQCKGCAANILCFKYTGKSCHSHSHLPHGMKSCTDLSTSSEPIADIIVTDGNKTFVDGSFEVGNEFCVVADHDTLPAELSVSVSSPMGGNVPEPNQISVIDTTCEGHGLALMQSYGALDLTHFVNCEDDIDCSVPVSFQVFVTNDSSEGVNITEIALTLDGTLTKLVDNSATSDWHVESGEKFNANIPSIAEYCMSDSLQANAVVYAKSSDGSLCTDEASAVI
jgi:hypothetical protein